jgi:hypothetical protein
LAAKHQVPTLVGVNGNELAVAVVLLEGARPSEGGMFAQLLPVAAGPHSENCTSPVGTPATALPVIVAVSVLLLPRTMVESVGVVVVAVGAFVTSKHSSAVESALVR